MSNLRVLRCSPRAYQQVARAAGEKGLSLSEALDSILSDAQQVSCCRFAVYDLVKGNTRAPAAYQNREGAVIAHGRDDCLVKFVGVDQRVRVRSSWLDPLPSDQAEEATMTAAR
jgi:hypothetical protein